MKEHIALIFKTVRTANKLTQAELAEKIDVSPGHIGLLEQGKAKPSYEVMEKMVCLYNIDANLFFGRTQKNTKSINASMIQSAQNMLSMVSEHLKTYGDDVDNSLTETVTEDAIEYTGLKR